VESDRAINGLLYPRSNASPITTLDVTPALRLVTGTATKTTAAGITTIWIFRTAFFTTSAEAQTAGEAGLMFYVATAINDGIAGTVAWTDDQATNSADQVQSDNFVAPEMQFVEYYDPYWWGIGNLPFVSTASWATSGGSTLVTLTGGSTWFDGRDGQNFTFSGLTTGGYDGNGTYKFLWISSTTGRVTLDGTLATVQTITPGSGTITIQGVATTLFRSKPRNPFSWGFTETIGDVNVPQQYAFKIGGGLATAIKVVPNSPTLKIDCELPAKCYTLNLRAAGTSGFEGTLRVISDVYSVTAHFSQFAATTANGQTVLWGIDFKNFAILQSDGISQNPISLLIPQTLRALTVDRTRQLLTHGSYDPRTELNCIWVSSENALSLVNYLIYQHAPTGFWGFSNEQDVLCSAAIQDTLTGQVKTFVGTQTGFVGQAFATGVWSNWLPDTGNYTGICSAATATSITTVGTDAAFNIVGPGMVGNWVMVTDPNGQQEQLARISVVTAHTLTFDAVVPYFTGITTQFNPIPVVGSKFYVGMIECEILKYFDFNLPQTDKRLMEMWLTQQNVDATTTGTLIRFYRERSSGYVQFAPLQNVYDDATGSEAWFVDESVPSELVKMFGLEIINRGYQQWKFINMVLKPNLDP
jgi:hypothetical protein